MLERKTGWQNSRENQQTKLEEGNNKAKTRNQCNKKQTYSKKKMSKAKKEPDFFGVVGFGGGGGEFCQGGYISAAG